MSSFERFASLLFWVCAAGVAYAYAGYPLVICALSRLAGRRSEPALLADANLPSVSLLIAAHNEASVIEGRIENALALDYPAGRLEILIASDGSDDGTADLARRYVGRGVRVLDFRGRRGKATVLNDAAAQATGQILALSDANTFTDPDALRRMVRWFEEPTVGVVCGRLVLTDPDTGANADGIYWKYETFLKKCEGRLGALLGSNGAIYAMRRRLYEPIAPNTIVDDFVIPLQAKLRTDCQIVYDCSAIAHEETAPDVAAEFRRRSRIGAGGYQAIGLLWRLLDPRRGWVAFSFMSHKILRWVCPFLMLGALVGSLSLIDRPFFRLALLCQACFYGLSLVGTLVPGVIRLSKVLRVSAMFAGMNAALLVGFFRWAGGTQKGVWARTARLSTETA